MATELKRVLISDEVDQKCIDVFEQNGIQAVKKTKLSKEELIKEIQGYDGLIVRSATKVTKEIIDSTTRLKIVGRAGTGVDNVDIDAATRKGVIVMNTPGGNTISAAEHTCALICAMARNVAAGDASMKAGRWDRKLFMGTELSGKTLAILGLGQIGKQVAIRMQAFGMRTIGFDPIVPAEAAAEFNVQKLSLEDIWPQADYITVHVPLIAPTKYMINAETLAKCKKGVALLNVARGGIIEETALLEGLKSGHVGCAALDVFEAEPPTAAGAELAKHPKVTATPHLGASTLEAQTRVAVEIAQQFVDFTTGKKLFGAINAAAIASTLDPKCQAWIKLAGSLGALVYKLACGESRLGAVEMQLTVTGCGEALNKAKYLLNAALVGILHADEPNGFNLINALQYAEEKSISASFVDEASVPPTKMAGIDAAIKLCVAGKDCSWQVVGTASPAGPLLLSINDAQFPFGCALNGPEMLLAKTSPTAIPEVMASMVAGGVSVGSFVSSSALKDGSTWAIINATGHYDVNKLKHLGFVASMKLSKHLHLVKKPVQVGRDEIHVIRAQTFTPLSKTLMMAARPINFSAGPAKLPLQVLEIAQNEMCNFAKTGCSVMEISHRSAEFKHIISQAETTLRELWNIPHNYKVLFLQGGATGQFASIPLNLMTSGKADYIVTGTWSNKAAKEAEKYGRVNYVLPKTSKYTTIPEKSTWNLDPEADYCYYCVNETVQGIEFQEVPEIHANVPLVADMSSNALTKPIDVTKFGIIYACTQKNLGTAGLTVMVVRDDLIGNQRKDCPAIFDFKLMNDNESLYNTPPTWSIYITKLFLDWLLQEGGMKHFETLSQQKSRKIYDIIDSSQNFYRGTVEKSARSRMNICFRINANDGAPSQQLEDSFFAEGKKCDMISMKGHRSVGGVRICLYNAMSMEETEKLAKFMKQFLAENNEQ